MSGSPKVGGTLRCDVTYDSDTPAKVTARWFRQGRSAKPVGTKQTYEVTKADRGRRLVCFPEVTNDGGVVAAPTQTLKPVRIAG
jgi:hypothetical protein